MRTTHGTTASWVKKMIIAGIACLAVATATIGLTGAANATEATGEDDALPSYAGKVVDRSVDPDGFLPDISPLEAAPDCIDTWRINDWFYGYMQNVQNDCVSPPLQTRTDRVKVIVAFGPDSSCHTLTAENASGTRPGEVFRHDLTPDATARFDGLVSC